MTHKPDDESREQVMVLAAIGCTEDDIAAVTGITGPTLRKHYRSELDNGHAKANGKVAAALFKKATGEGPQAVTAAIFWMKTRARWTEAKEAETLNVNVNVDPDDLTDAELARIVAAGRSREASEEATGAGASGPVH